MKIATLVCFILFGLNYCTHLKVNQFVRFLFKNMESPESLQIPDFDEDLPGFLQKGSKSKPQPVEEYNRYDGLGFINPDKLIVDNKNKYSSLMRFKGDSPESMFNNIRASNPNPNAPAESVEQIRKQGLSNGIVLTDKKRSCNFETAKYAQIYLSLEK